jgi:hypothetical protein
LFWSLTALATGASPWGLIAMSKSHQIAQEEALNEV